MAFVNGPVAECFEREVTASPAEFERDLRKASPCAVETVAPHHFRLCVGPTRLDIHVVPRGVRRLGILQLQTLSVRYEFFGGTESDRRALLVPLDRAMQRGGG
ncbi:hypothetical protein [Aromatoleum petrolei]|uniref:Uncharacterized protein n=1 Tax=Aromatoleum petrolei TaxID=76116 RepID=A0ABX1MME3_9RHOO|nr:hypothetical protein [Aromatoleum petrolei]NMF89120.1 hypothetical protein [Aromatoleum petrolei]QTQ38287.1 Uncharacterized protein ToN1_41830 [Aromatoleum petrolei]